MRSSVVAPARPPLMSAESGKSSAREIFQSVLMVGVLCPSSTCPSIWNTDRLRSTTGPTFAGGTTDYHHAAADLVFKWLGIALQAEYLWKRASVDQIFSANADGSPRTEYTRSAHGWVLQTSYTFQPPLEIVGRLSRMYALRGTDPRFATEVDTRGQEVAAGVSYYLNGHRFKVQAD
jgi:hypothetical protein